MVRSCLLVTLITYLKGHKSLGLLYNCQLGHEGNMVTDRPTDNRQTQWLRIEVYEDIFVFDIIFHFSVRISPPARVKVLLDPFFFKSTHSSKLSLINFKLYFT